MIQLIEIQLLK